MSTKDPLAALVVDDRDVARDELAGALRRFVRFTQAGDVLLERDFEGLTAARKVCCILLAARAMELLGLRESAQVSPKEVVEASGLPPGTVRPKLVELARARLAKADHGVYTTPIHAIRRAASFVEGAND